MNLLEECRGAGRIGISGHIRPDGDCIGSCMGLYLYLKKEWKRMLELVKIGLDSIKEQ